MVLYQELAEVDQAVVLVVLPQSVQRVHMDYLVAPAAEAQELAKKAQEMLAVFLPQKVKTAEHLLAAAEDTQELEYRLLQACQVSEAAKV